MFGVAERKHHHHLRKHTFFVCLGNMTARTRSPSSRSDVGDWTRLQGIRKILSWSEPEAMGGGAMHPTQWLCFLDFRYPAGNLMLTFLKIGRCRQINLNKEAIWERGFRAVSALADLEVLDSISSVGFLVPLYPLFLLIFLEESLVCNGYMTVLTWRHKPIKPSHFYVCFFFLLGFFLFLSLIKKALKLLNLTYLWYHISTATWCIHYTLTLSLSRFMCLICT